MSDVTIEIEANGNYHVIGPVILERVSKVVEDGRPVRWEIDTELGTEDETWLCRCGHSTEKPYCTNAHVDAGFDGTETAPTDLYADRAKVLGGTDVTVLDDRSICAHASFCANAVTNVWKLSKRMDDDPALTDEVVHMVRMCPSGALSLVRDGQIDEADLPPRIRIQKDGPLLLNGNIVVKRADGQNFEVRNRVALCRCGNSKNKPLCDGSHTDAGFTDG